MVSLGKYNLEVINHINIFENITKARVKDCFIDGNNKFVFIVNKEDIGRAIGKNGMNLKRVENVLKKRIKVVSFSDDVKEFVVSYSNPVKVEGVTANDNIVETAMAMPNSPANENDAIIPTQIIIAGIAVASIDIASP